jgi:ABC-type multidrug transport system fused ATPase/permease subunit
MLKALSLFWLIVSPHLAPQKSRLMWVIVFASAATLGVLEAQWILKSAVDIDIAQSNVSAFFTNLMKALAVFFLSFVFWGLQQRLAVIVTEEIFSEIKGKLLAQLFLQPRILFDRISDSDITLRVNVNLRDAAAIFRDDIIAGFVDLLIVIGLVIGALFIHWQGGLSLMFAIFVYGAIVGLSEAPLRKSADNSANARSKQNKLLLDLLGARRDIKLFNVFHTSKVNFTRAVQEVSVAQSHQGVLSSIVRSVAGFVGAISTLIVVAVYGALIIDKDPSMTIGLLVALLGICAVLMKTLTSVLIKVDRIVMSAASLSRVIELLVLPSNQQTSATLIDVETPDIPDLPSIAFVNVGYRGSQGAEPIANLSFHIEAGDRVAIVGNSGSGKSLLLDLLMRMRQPSSGQIFYSGINIEQIPLDLYYSAFGFVGQSSHIMRVTVRQFLAQGWPGQREVDFWRVLELVQLASLVKSMPNELDTTLGFSFWQLTTSQLQRLSIARALIRDPQVLILDDISLGIDQPAELAFMRSLLDDSNAMRTVICTTASPEVAALFDRVITLAG